ncbi:MAG: hypothetical protein LBH60_03735, partial [Prevotellaceae bacterium]|nr:hypothetical protein [Prevotellaceae bacterium]
MSEQFIVCLIENPVWGYILQPVLVGETKYGALLIREIVERESSCFASLTADQKAIVYQYEKYTEKTLMKNFAKEKNIVDFREKVTPEKVERFIRPVIESTHRKIVPLIRKAKIPVYIRKNIKTRNLHETNRISVSCADSGVIFNFCREASGDLIYYIRVKSENEIINLRSRFLAIICNEPAIVVIDDVLLTFNDIDAKKLQPFITKNYIRVHAASYRTYIDKFVVNCVKKYEVKSEGLKINDVNPAKQALLNLGYDLKVCPVLYLSFRYDKKTVSPNNLSTQKAVYVDDSSGEAVINRYSRDREWENSMAALLLANGLKQSEIGAFYAETDEKAGTIDRIGAIIKWIRANSSVMASFEFTQSIAQTVYYTGKIETVTQIGRKEDWFDIDCMVVFDDFKIPFSSFRNHILEGIREYVLPDRTVVILPDE